MGDREVGSLVERPGSIEPKVKSKEMSRDVRCRSDVHLRIIVCCTCPDVDPLNELPKWRWGRSCLQPAS